MTRDNLAGRTTGVAAKFSAWLLSRTKKLRKAKMSSRVLRKLQGEKELEISHDDEEDEDELNFTPVKSRKKQKAAVNPFDLVSTFTSLPTYALAGLRTRKYNIYYIFKSLVSSLQNICITCFVQYADFLNKNIFIFLLFLKKNNNNITRKSFNILFKLILNFTLQHLVT